MPVHCPKLRHGCQQRFSIRMLGSVKNLLNAASFYRLALIHHQHAVGNIRHNAHIVGNKDHSHRHILLQHFYQLQDLRLNGDIQRGCRLISN